MINSISINDNSLKSDFENNTTEQENENENLSCEYKIHSSSSKGVKTTECENDTYYFKFFDYDSDGINDEVYRLIFDIENSSEYEMLNIDNDIDYNSQGGLPDCWLLASLESLNISQKGKEYIDSFFDLNEDGSYAVHFATGPKEIIVSQEELSKVRKDNTYSSGDNTVLLLEVAYNKFLNELKENPQNYDAETLDVFSKLLKSDNDILLDYANMTQFSYAFLGNRAENTTSKKELLNLDLENNFAFISFKPNNKWKENLNGVLETQIEDVNKKSCSLEDRHAYAIVGIDKKKKTITIVNPIDNSKEYVCKIKDLEKNSDEFSVEYFSM